jgi:hypothetical protein
MSKYELIQSKYTNLHYGNVKDNTTNKIIDGLSWRMINKALIFTYDYNPILLRERTIHTLTFDREIDELLKGNPIKIL